MLGIDPGQAYEEVRVPFPVGATVVLYTDGVVEARLGHELFGVERLDATLAALADEPAQRIAEEVLVACRVVRGRGPRGRLRDRRDPPHRVTPPVLRPRADGRPLVVGHRGAAALARENSLEAVEAALRLGVDLVELDVVARADGSLAVAHDVHAAAAAPSFDEALDLLAASRAGLLLDLKAPGIEAAPRPGPCAATASSSGRSPAASARTRSGAARRRSRGWRARSPIRTTGSGSRSVLARAPSCAAGS